MQINSDKMLIIIGSTLGNAPCQEENTKTQIRQHANCKQQCKKFKYNKTFWYSLLCYAETAPACVHNTLRWERKLQARNNFHANYNSTHTCDVNKQIDKTQFIYHAGLVAQRKLG